MKEEDKEEGRGAVRCGEKHTHTHIHTHIYAHILPPTYTHILSRICTHTHTHTYVHTHTPRTFIHTHTHTHKVEKFQKYNSFPTIKFFPAVPQPNARTANIHVARHFLFNLRIPQGCHHHHRFTWNSYDGLRCLCPLSSLKKTKSNKYSALPCMAVCSD